MLERPLGLYDICKVDADLVGSLDIPYIQFIDLIQILVLYAGRTAGLYDARRLEAALAGASDILL